MKSFYAVESVVGCCIMCIVSGVLAVKAEAADKVTLVVFN